MPGPAFRRGETVALHPANEEDIGFLHEHANDPEVRWGLTTAFPRTRTEVEERHEQYADDDSGVGLLVVPRDDDEPVGRVVGFDIDPTHGIAELAAWVDPDHHGRGYASEATALLVDHLFAEHRLHRLVARAIVPNGPSRAVLEGLGFREEGVQPAEKYVDGQHVGVVRYAMLAREWDGVEAALGGEA